ncbi:MAG: 23S rRNA (pseudouridine(1915)-N(3))-methyltransferase RlmH [Syntrophomonadaceae bacterium]
MRYRIISVGKISEKFYAQGVAEYLKRLTPYVSWELVEGLEEKVSPRAGAKDIEKALNKEGERILALLGDRELLVVLDSHGIMLTSEELAGCMQDWHLSGVSRVNLIIGGSHGLAEIVKKRADRIIAFSRMTFPHQMAALITAEQIYRGFRIIKGEPYHK